MSYIEEDPNRSRPGRIEYATNWPALIAFVTLLSFFICASTVGLIANSGTGISRDAAANKSPQVAALMRATASLKKPLSTTADKNTDRQRFVPRRFSAVVELPSVPLLPIASASQSTKSQRGVAANTQPEPLSNRECDPSRRPLAVEPTRERFRVPKYEFEFLANLEESATELDLDSVPGTSMQLLSASGQVDPALLSENAIPAAYVRDKLLAQRSDLFGLPFRLGLECRTEAKHLEATASVSASVNGALLRALRLDRTDVSYSEVIVEKEAIFNTIRSSTVWGQPEAISTMVQMLQVETLPMRLDLVDALSSIRHPLASEALADRAMFDAAQEVRLAAVETLKTLPAEEYRHRLLAGIRFPWAPAAYFAARALVSVEDRRSVWKLVDLLDEADPSAPYVNEDGILVKNEFVRVNHLRNCVLCHAPSMSQSDPIRGVVPTPGSPISPSYYKSTRGNFVRGDVVYLRQDFSAMHQVEDAGAWPETQRFDYLVRTRELTPKECIAANDSQVDRHAGGPETSLYPQKHAVLMALRELTGKDAGASSENWRNALREWSPAD